MIYLHLKCKFRAFFIDFGKVDQKFSVPLGVSVPIPSFDTTLYNNKGVYLRASSNPIP